MRKIKTRLKHKKWSEIFWFFMWRIFLIEIVFLMWLLLDISSNIHSNNLFRHYVGVDLNYYLEPIRSVFSKAYEFMTWFIEGFKKHT